MAITNRKVLKSYFEAGKIPTQQHYEELIDSMLNLPDDGIENGSKDIKVAEGLLLTPGGCWNAAREHYRHFSKGKSVKIQTNIPFALTVEGPPILIVEGYNFTTMETIGLMVAFKYVYNDDFKIPEDSVEEDIRKKIANKSAKPISDELKKITGKKTDPDDKAKKIDATWVIDAKQPELVWEIITNTQEVQQPVKGSLADLNESADLSHKAIATAWGSYRSPLKLKVEEEKIVLLMALEESSASNEFRVSLNVRAVGGKLGYEDWYKGWEVVEATEDDISGEALQDPENKQWSVDVDYAP